MKLIDALEHGRDKARSREFLRTLTGLSDRKLRQQIEDLRESGVFVCTDEDGRGYYISHETEDLKRQMYKDVARIKAIRKRSRVFERELKARGAI